MSFRAVAAAAGMISILAAVPREDSIQEQLTAVVDRARGLGLQGLPLCAPAWHWWRATWCRPAPAARRPTSRSSRRCPAPSRICRSWEKSGTQAFRPAGTLTYPHTDAFFAQVVSL
jgi:hypothetical protein